VAPNSGIDWIEFHAPEDGSEVQVIAVGTSLHPEMPTGMIVSSKITEGFMGRVIVEVEDGVITAMEGDSFSYGDPLRAEDAEMIRDQLYAEREYPSTTVIVRENRFLSDLIEDSDGNLVPRDITEKQKIFCLR
jgi:hypothetical protein